MGNGREAGGDRLAEKGQRRDQFQIGCLQAGADSRHRAQETETGFGDRRAGRGAFPHLFNQTPRGSVRTAIVQISIRLIATTGHPSQQIGAGGVDTPKMREIDHDPIRTRVLFNLAQSRILPADRIDQPVTVRLKDRHPIFLVDDQFRRLGPIDVLSPHCTKPSRICRGRGGLEAGEEKLRQPGHTPPE